MEGYLVALRLCDRAMERFEESLVRNEILACQYGKENAQNPFVIS